MKIIILIFITTFITTNSFSSPGWPICQDGHQMFYKNAYKEEVWLVLQDYRNISKAQLSEDDYEKYFSKNINSSINNTLMDQCKKNPNDGNKLVSEYKAKCNNGCDENYQKNKTLKLDYLKACQYTCTVLGSRLFTYLRGLKDGEDKLTIEKNNLAKSCETAIEDVKADLSQANVSNSLRDQVKEDFLPIVNELNKIKATQH